MNTTKAEKTIKELFIGNCWQYLSDNFHKFSESNRIKIALELCRKDMPEENSGTHITMIVPTIKLADGQPLEYEFGKNRRVTTVPEDSPEAAADH